MRLLILLFFLSIYILQAAEREFDYYEFNGSKKGHTLLVIGGVHGDEPGGYFAPALILKHYKITKGSLYIVPNLNFDSIVENRRGIYGDMNRKFADIQKSDRDYELVQKIKTIMLKDEVDFIVNLHDGRGFYRNEWVSSIFNPKAWGQSFVIDQQTINDVKFGNLDEITNQIAKNLNSHLKESHHTFNVKNTQTKDKDEAMQKSLTYFAITHLKPAIAIETSKNINELSNKVFYQLKAIEEIMQLMEIEFKRDFDLTIEGVKEIIYRFGTLKINNNIALELDNINSTLRFVPLKKGKNSFIFEHPLGDASFNGRFYKINIGHLNVTNLHPQYFSMECKYSNALMIVDGAKRDVRFGDTIEVSNSFEVVKNEDFRVNVIGFITKGDDSQDGFEIKKDDILDRFSIDRDSKTFRVEFYTNGNFCGMVGIKFISN